MSVAAYQHDAIWFGGGRNGVAADCRAAGRGDSGSGGAPPAATGRRKRVLIGGRRGLSAPGVGVRGYSRWRRGTWQSSLFPPLFELTCRTANVRHCSTSGHS
jgi:hypothetical protein